MLSVSLVCVCGVVAFGYAARSDNGNFLDDKWLSGRWDRFRDEPGTWIPGKPFDQALDPAKDPCLKIKCGRHKVCVAENDQTATCVSQRRVSFKDAGLYQSPRSKCKQCPVVRPSPVCGTDGHSYSSTCKLEYQACITGKKITVKCPGQCPCPAHQVCSEAELMETVGRLQDWFRVLHDNSNHNKKVKIQKPEKNRFDPGVSPICKEPVLGWMFSRLDSNSDLQLDQTELAVLPPESCSHAFLQTCHTHHHKLLSSAEWCTCFQRHSESPCKSELSDINKNQAGKKLLGQYLPTCDEEGYYRSHQCHSSSGQCWCVDRYGNEVASSRTHGPADCGVVLESSGDMGSGDSLFSDDDDDEDDDDEDSFVLKDRTDMDDEDDGDEDGEGDDDEYLS